MGRSLQLGRIAEARIAIEWMQKNSMITIVIDHRIVGALLLVSLAATASESGKGLPQSKTLARGSEVDVLAKPGLHKPLTEPPCSYCSTQNRKNFVRPDDRVIAWIRAAHNGGAVPLRHFLAAPRVINDTYGLFFYDPDGGYVSAFEKNYGFEFYGWRRGVMVARSEDGTLWSALTGRAFEGPRKGEQLRRVASMMTDWGHWLMLHPESTAYDMFDGKKYPMAELPQQMSSEAKQTMGKADDRLKPETLILGVELIGRPIAIPLDSKKERAVYQGDIAAFWYGVTGTAVAFSPELEGRRLTFYASETSPETAPFKDKETGTRWTLAGRGVDGPLRGKELQWVDSIQCKWYAWAAEYPGTEIFKSR